MICHSTFSCDPTFVINPQQRDSQVIFFFSPSSALWSVHSESYYISRGGKCNGSPQRRPIISAYEHMHQNSASLPVSPALPPFFPPSLLALDKCGLFLSCRRSELISHGPRALALITLPAKTEISHSPIGPAISQWLTPACTPAWHCPALLRFSSEIEIGPATSRGSGWWGVEVRGGLGHTTGRNSTPSWCFQKAKLSGRKPKSVALGRGYFFSVISFLLFVACLTAQKEKKH